MSYQEIILKWPKNRVIAKHEHEFPEISEDAPATFLFAWDSRNGWELHVEVNPNLTTIPTSEVDARMRESADFTPGGTLLWGDETVYSDQYVGYVQGSYWMSLSFDSPRWRKRRGYHPTAVIPRSLVNSAGNAMANWARGDAYRLEHQKLVTYHAEGTGNLLQRWETGDGELRGIFTNDPEQLRTLAKSLFEAPSDAEFVW